jgi:hypothetical protein
MKEADAHCDEDGHRRRSKEPIKLPTSLAKRIENSRERDGEDCVSTERRTDIYLAIGGCTLDNTFSRTDALK